MLKKVEKTAKTVDEAVKAALEEMELEEYEVDVEVLEEGAKGIFGLLSQDARVIVTARGSSNAEGIASSFLDSLLDAMGIAAFVKSELDENNVLRLDLSGKDMGVIIGKRGDTLDALQYLTSLVVNKNSDDYVKVVLDAENYRQRRSETLVSLAKRLEDKVIRTKKSMTLEPMNPFERRVIHEALQNSEYVTTYSTGDEPRRKVVVARKK